MTVSMSLSGIRVSGVKGVYILLIRVITNTMIYLDV